MTSTNPTTSHDEKPRFRSHLGAENWASRSVVLAAINPTSESAGLDVDDLETLSEASHHPAGMKTRGSVVGARHDFTHTV
jgi:hypothetical protein